MKLYNSLSRTKELVKLSDTVGVYTCGPTVYSYVSIGNWRTYALGDLMVRALLFFGHEVNYVMNITDVGHMTGDNEGDADTGEDRLEKAARKERKTAWEIADMYGKDFLAGYEMLGLAKPNVFCKATDHIQEQIEMVEAIEKAGFSYEISDGIYFDVAAYEKAGSSYGVLSTIDEVKEGARVEPNPEKRDPRDFALWKFNTSSEPRDMEWDSPWGVGFPGWHIECSAMSTKYLGEQFDIHIGGEDLRSTHHPNEIAQAEAATGKKPFVKYWIHGAFLLVDGGRMGKSLGNAYTLQDISEKGFDALDLKYFYLGGHYRKQQNFTWEALLAAKQARSKLIRLVAGLDVSGYSGDVSVMEEEYYARFSQALSDDLNAPKALGVLWEVVQDKKLSDQVKLQLVLAFDKVFGIGILAGVEKLAVTDDVPEVVANLLKEREAARMHKQFDVADELRAQIENHGYVVVDDKDGARLEKR